MTNLIDSHAHIDDATFDPDRAEVIARAREAGLEYLLAVGGGTGIENLGAALKGAESHEWIYASVGIHPHDAAKAESRRFESLRQLVAHPKVVGLGEIGLDYHYNFSPHQTQQHVLIQQLELARERKLPVIIHCRDAWNDLTDIIQQHWAPHGLGGILHCFSGGRDDALRFLDWGFLISFAGNVTYPKAANLRAVAQLVPLDGLLSETDCPYLAPIPHRGKRNEPAYVREVTRTLAALHDVNEEEMGRQIIANFVRLFGIPTNRQ